MAVDHSDVLERFSEWINTGVIPEAVLATDFEMVNATTAVTDNVYYGHEGVQRWRQDLFEAFKEGVRFEYRVEGTAPETAVIRCRIIGEGSASSAPIDLRWMAVLSIRDGQVTRAAGFTSRDEAFREAGLEPPD